LGNDQAESTKSWDWVSLLANLAICIS